MGLNKTEFITINRDQGLHNIEENVTIKQVQNFKYLNDILNKKDINLEDIVSKNCKARQIIVCLNSLWCYKNISLENKFD